MMDAVVCIEGRNDHARDVCGGCEGWNYCWPDNDG